MDEDILKRFEQDAQLRIERMPEIATDKEVRQAAEKLRVFMAKHQVKQSQIAKMFNVSTAKLSCFLRGTYKARKGRAELVNKILALIESYGRKERIRKGPYIETTVAKAIAAIIARTEALSDVEGRIGLVIGDGGHGKSVCLREYAAANPNSIYIQLDDTMRSRAIFGAIAEAIGLDGYGMLQHVKERVEKHLQYRHVILMLDEASGLQVKELNQLRQVIVVKAGKPLILSGNSDLLKTVMQPKTRRGCESLDQFTSRLSYILNLDKIAADRKGGLYTADDIRKLYQYGGVRLAGDAVKLLQRISRSPRSGRLRTCSNVITALHTAKEIQRDGVITADNIIQVIEQMQLPIQAWLPLAITEEEEQQRDEAIAKAG